MTIRKVEPEKSYRLLNHGPTVMISAKHGEVENVMTAAWVCALDFSPTKLTVVLDKGSYTRGLLEQSGLFAVQLPFATQAAATVAAGTQSRHNHPNNLTDCGIELFYQPDFDVPLVKDCAAWLVCKLISEPHNQQTYDLFIGEVLEAWADERVFRNGHWHFDEVGDELKTLHYVAGGQFYITGKGLVVESGA